ncbi:MAG: hypothetical protein ABFD89_23840 [Bryobacteraceae bacterium]
MARERSTTLGLNTDAPPDRLEDQALRMRNVTPTSASSVGVRGGSEDKGHYRPLSLGRCLMVDKLPGAAEGEYMVVIVNVSKTGTAVRRQIDGLFRFHAELTTQPADFGLGGDAPPVRSLYGVVV